MPLFTKYDQFTEDFANKVHDLFGTAGSGADTLKVALTNTAPDHTAHKLLADITQLSAGHGYSSGGASATNVGVRSGGTLSVTGTDIVFTATSDSIGPFRYLVLYNATAANGPLIGYWDIGTEITLANTQTYTVAFDGSAILIVG